MRISIVEGSISGTIVYSETQTPTTNSNGLISIEIGSGTVSNGDLSDIAWSNGPYFIKTETDPTDGTNYTITGTSQLMSVPYALHSKTAESITGSVNYTETDPIFEASVANGITTTDTANWNNHIVDTDTHLDEVAVDAFVANNGYSTGVHTVDTDTHLDTAGVTALGFVLGAEININADWNATTGDAKILNKPTIPSAANGSETKVTAGTNVIVTGIGTTANPYVVSSGAHYVGELFGGGIVFYTYNNGTNGLIASLHDLTEGIGVAWSGNTTTPIGPSAKSMTNGASNTLAIVNQDASAGAAATLCNSYINGNFSNWYLPSNRELYLLASQDVLIDQVLDNDGNSTTNGFTQEYLAPTFSRYWSSTEYGATSFAWCYDFSSGVSSYNCKYNKCLVRAVRKF
jgi:hypothetical protein